MSELQVEHIVFFPVAKSSPSKPLSHVFRVLSVLTVFLVSATFHRALLNSIILQRQSCPSQDNTLAVCNFFEERLVKIGSKLYIG